MHTSASTTASVTPTSHLVINPTYEPTPSPYSTARHTLTSTSTMSSVSRTSHIFISPTQQPMPSPISTATHTGSSTPSPFFSSSSSISHTLTSSSSPSTSITASVSSTVYSSGASIPMLSSRSSPSPHTLLPSTLPTKPLPHVSPSSVSSTIIPPSSIKTTPSTPFSHNLSSHSTTSQSTSLTTRNPTSGIFSSTMGITSPTTNLTTGPPTISRLPTTVILTTPTSGHGSSTLPNIGSPSTVGPSVSSLVTSPSSSTGVCDVKELEEEVTYRGCTANVTVTRCEGSCPASASFNIYTNQVDTHCSCCHPVSSYQKQFVLPCSDPEVLGQQLVLTLQMFSSCACSPQHCGV
nr:mucin-6-like [Vulpes vulpes]